MRKSAVLLLAAAVAVAVAAAALAATRGGEAPSSAAATRTIASASTTDFRVVLAARKGAPAGGAASAEVALRLYARSAAGWRRTGEQQLPGTYFWKTVTAPRAVCRLELQTASERHEFAPRAVVQLLVTPSLGCGPTRAVPLAAAR